MSIQEVVPVLSELTEEQAVAIEKTSECHDVPFGFMLVDAFHEGAIIREAFAQYWEPNHDTKLASVLWNACPEGLLQCLGRDNEYDFLVEVRIILTYPLNEYWEARAKIPANRIGEIFAITYDMYKHIYDLDDQNWQSEGHQDETPRAAPKCLNRARGKHVWGHDMSDLVFENVGFHLHPEWPTKDRDDEMKSIPELLDKDKHADTCPYLGTFTFSIGS